MPGGWRKAPPRPWRRPRPTCSGRRACPWTWDSSSRSTTSSDVCSSDLRRKACGRSSRSGRLRFAGSRAFAGSPPEGMAGPADKQDRAPGGQPAGVAGVLQHRGAKKREKGDGGEIAEDRGGQEVQRRDAGEPCRVAPQVTGREGDEPGDEQDSEAVLAAKAVHALKDLLGQKPPDSAAGHPTGDREGGYRSRGDAR